MNGAGLEIFKTYAQSGHNFHVGILLAFFIQDLDALVNKLRPVTVINVLSIIELNGRRSGISRNFFDLKLLRAEGKPVLFLVGQTQRRGQDASEKETMADKTHESTSI